jgi:hypothetical protein
MASERLPIPAEVVEVAAKASYEAEMRHQNGEDGAWCEWEGEPSNG